MDINMKNIGKVQMLANDQVFCFHQIRLYWSMKQD